MIRVNLSGAPKKKAGGRKGLSIQLPTNALPVIWVAIILGTALYGYTWYSGLTSETADLATRISSAEGQLAQLQSVIDEDAAFEARREELANRIATIEGLQRDQVSPVVLLDRLSQAITPTEYVWLDQLQLNDTVITMAGVGTSVNAIADFVSSLEETGYFQNINLVNAQDTAGTFSFQMSCDFFPPPLAVEEAEDGESEAEGEIEDSEPDAN
jgi:Tfp pilus assembly protein PilN